MNIIAHFPYLQTIHPLVGRLFEPVVEVTLTYKALAVRQLMFLDSGADISLIPASLGAALGLRPSDVQSSTNVRSLVTERTPLRIVELHIQIGATAPVPVRMGWIESDAVSPLLGRLDVFEHYTYASAGLKSELRKSSGPVAGEGEAFRFHIPH